MSDDRIQLLRTAFVVYYHRDLDKARTFMLDFGLTIASELPGETIYFRGYGSEPYVYVCHQSQTGRSYFGGAAYVVASFADLDKARTSPHGDGQIRQLDGPGGGRAITLTDPAGHQVHLIHDWTTQPATTAPHLEKLTVNFEDEKPRKGRFQRFAPGPAPVFRWGHYGVTYPTGAYQTMYDWYTKTLTLAPSDVVYRDGVPVTCFFHIDRGTEYTDHHCFFFKAVKPDGEPDVAHAAFEVHDFDVQQLGHQHLESKGYELCWGVGRHVLGSQVFDYWFDTSGFMVEHYADGDVVNCDTPVGKAQAGPQALSVWGPPVPAVF
ncbi:Glyoxalase/Bleomycin resistance protein/Dihydroxybiphenyl dioxygenase [Neohortaea acidophila]|uniref:Glyoxalase/Bleomycin resistance protein/Dihydroxybiphenyl dioxygenase n=1 Tax=Neohortaea acidophila TaxID=245834 RepID=A0A6A6Q0R9_9PEZI|nr:Glyoxalase/Bleomycin resistance protein/Dihydroxybiphenyl dioxygenase [Neohortaea acidophila]KAF2485017.1 Glyoxalase/Bleomycin resistance protein/Dihydroxybiphenyl dioxygenase [Neohortaea acidophila]